MLLTIILLLVIFGAVFWAAFIRLWQSPPSINVTFTIPPEFKLVLQKVPAIIETEKSSLIPIPEDILRYISLESDVWAQEGRKKRARALYADAQNWPVVFQLMRQEDENLERA